MASRLHTDNRKKFKENFYRLKNGTLSLREIEEKDFLHFVQFQTMYMSRILQCAIPCPVFTICFFGESKSGKKYTALELGRRLNMDSIEDDHSTIWKEKIFTFFSVFNCIGEKYREIGDFWVPKVKVITIDTTAIQEQPNLQFYHLYFKFTKTEKEKEVGFEDIRRESTRILELCFTEYKKFLKVKGVSENLINRLKWSAV